MGHLNKLHEEYDGKGMTILSATGESRETVEPFVEKYGAIFPILCKASTGSYSTGGVPQAYLIGAEGKVLWQGHPGNLGDDDIETALKDVKKDHRIGTSAFTIMKQVPELPEKMAPLLKMMQKLKFGAALSKAESILPKLEGSEQELGQAVRDWISKRGEDMLASAESMISSGDVYAGVNKYKSVEDEYKGHALSKQAKAAGKKVLADKANKTEFKAWEKLVAIKKTIATEKKAEDKLAALKPLLSKKYADTKAGKEAKKLASSFGG